jgi:hypothetical protein
VSDSSIKNLFKKEMTRRQFLGLSVFALASLFGIVGIIEELKSHAATPFLSEEAENGTLAAPATVVADSLASSSKAIKFGSSSVVSSVITVDRGAWNNQTTYAYDDKVTYNGQTWYVVRQTGVTGYAPGSDATRWGTAVAA